VSKGPVAAAGKPPVGLAGLDPKWSRLISATDTDGIDRTWHVLDNRVPDPRLTVLCVHGNPTWSYLWRDVIAAAPADIRVVAVDQLDMGYSERTGTVRRLGQRVADLDAVTAALELTGPVITVGHDWGGPISLGWAEEHSEHIAGIVLLNTAVHQQAGATAPVLIRMARSRPVRRIACVTTPAFLQGTLALGRPYPNRRVRAGYLAPYRSRSRREAIGTFVADIPLDPHHPSAARLDEIAGGLAALRDVPALLLWGPDDPVFSDRYLGDLAARLPQSSIHRYEGRGHLVPEDADVAAAIYSWIGAGDPVRRPVPEGAEGVDAALDRRRADDAIAVAEMDGSGPARSMSFSELAADVDRIAAGLRDLGIGPGTRVGLLVPPGIDLAAVVFACWRIGAVIVVADAGLGVGGLRRAMRGASPSYLIGVPFALLLARAMRWPGKRIVSTHSRLARLAGAVTTLAAVRLRGEHRSLPDAPRGPDLAAIGFTSGATGPPKGVIYRHHQLQSQRDLVRAMYRIEPDDKLVAAFGPFALFGPALGIPSIVPDMKVIAPGSLTAVKLADAARVIDATLVFAAPAALANVAATSSALGTRQREAFAGVRLVMCAGAPVPAATLRAIAALMPNAELHTPYGMTEVLPVTDISLDEIETVGAGNGVCVGHPIPGVEIAVSGLDDEGRATGPLVADADTVGEICIRAGHMRDGYDRLWATQHAASQPPGWHRSGDVGHIDAAGRLWIEGRTGHVITTAAGPVTPVGIEHRVIDLSGVSLAAAVGVGPVGTQQVVVVVVPDAAPSRAGLAPPSLTSQVRASAGVEVAAVLVAPGLPVDKRHNSKIDRSRTARWAGRVLAGGRIGRP
jgi:acyl-CoA synthetase (AMP-forming)/AMP-acid ligase II/pimeloyl-ACP methyl ester carboxylesterase